MLPRIFFGLSIALAGAMTAPMMRIDLHSTQEARYRTPIFTCGGDQLLPEPIPVRWTTVVLAGDGRLFQPCLDQLRHPPEDRENREAALIGQGFGAIKATDPELHWRAAQAVGRVSGGLDFMPAWGMYACDRRIGFGTNGGYGRVPRPQGWQPGYALFMLMQDPDLRVRKEGAYSIGVRLSEPGLDVKIFRDVVKELQGCLRRQTDSEVQGLMLEAIGAARYSTEQERTEAEMFLVKEAQGAGPRILGVVRGLDAMFRLNPQRVVSEETRVRLRKLVTYGVRMGTPPMLDVDARIRRTALMALQTARDFDLTTIRAAAGDSDWQVRRLVAGRLNLADPQQASVADLFKTEPAFQVRYDFLGPLARDATRTGVCAPVVERFKDPAPAVVLRAIDLLAPGCTDLGDAIPQLVDWADSLGRSETNEHWHVASRALTALARVQPELAKPRLAAAATHSVWQVRAAAAAASAVLAHEPTAVALLSDPEPNVRTAALDALFRINRTAVVPYALDALRYGADYHFLRTAALVLRGVEEESRDAASTALLGALRRLTDQETDTSRDPRVAMIERLAETLRPEWGAELLSFVADYDAEVSTVAAGTYTTLFKVSPSPSLAKRRRYPYQPQVDALINLPTEATIHLEQGSVTLQLLTDVAPVTIARFAALVTEGFYKDRTFHRVVPNFVVQGGSPGANEYMGTSRYMRDEVGPQAWHVRGAVGISTRGRDTGDGQIFIDLVDVPRLDREYTVFAYVTQGMELVDRLLEGAKIVSISVK